MPLKEIAERQNLLHAKSTPQTILKHVLDDVRLGDTALVSSFGAESVVLLHMISEIDKATPVIFIETEMLFDETLAYQQEVAEALGLTDVRVVKPSREAILVRDNEGLLHQADVDACCTLRKKEPLEKALIGFGSWITGRKRYQNGQRAALPVFEKDTASHRIKINPLAGWDPDQLSDYIDAHDLPRHPLVAKGFPSIGCKPCTHAVGVSDDPRAGRWKDTEKTECGIHF
jgi:phosphoadenosine phosphosulfate reductase